MLFNLTADPQEQRDLSASQPEVVAHLKARIVALASAYPALQYPGNDPAANPELHGGSWTPWR